MEIDINQRKISLGDKYDVYLDGKPSYTASSKLFRLFPEIYLFELGISKPKYVIKKRISFFRVAFDLLSPDDEVHHFRTIKYWKGHFYCQIGQDYYEVFAHKGRKYSVYKNDTQIAWWHKEAVSWFNGDNYKIIADFGNDTERIISFCLIIDNAFSSSNNNSTVTIDFGQVWSGVKQFDTSWKPKQSQ